jgi:hypothetical protein
MAAASLLEALAHGSVEKFAAGDPKTLSALKNAKGLFDDIINFFNEDPAKYEKDIKMRVDLIRRALDKISAAPASSPAPAAKPAAPATPVRAPAAQPAEGDVLSEVRKAILAYAKQRGSDLVNVADAIKPIMKKFPPKEIASAILKLDREGLIELRSESGIGLLSAEEAKFLPPGPDGIPLSYARMLKSAKKLARQR